MYPTVILASQSPRRKELLSLCVKDFAVQVSEIDEKEVERKILAEAGQEDFIETARKLVETLAREKAAVIHRLQTNAMVIGADTVVVLDNRVLGKPMDADEAYAMLRSLAGRTHSVLTGVSIQWGELEETFAVETKVHFFDWDAQMDAEVRAYIASGSPLDKAGAYGIQEEAGLWVERIEGDYNNIVGLPVASVNKAMQRMLSAEA